MTDEDVRFVIGRPPAQYTLAFEPFLYNQEAFLRLKNEEYLSFYAVDGKYCQILARAHFRLLLGKKNYKAVSLPQCPFGSIEYAASVASELMLNFVSSVSKALEVQNVDSIEIRDCISAYRPAGNHHLLSALNQVGFEQRDNMPNHHIKIDDQPPEEKMHRMEKKRLRKCKKAGFVFREEPLDRINFYYQFLSTCRHEKGWELSMSRHELINAIDKLPDSHKIFALYDGERCIAACLGVMVNRQIFYDFYHDSLRSYASFSPVVMLVARMYDVLRSHGVEILDMGTSLTTSLQSFKTHLGGQLSGKRTFVKA